MTDLPFTQPAAEFVVPTPRRCRRHRWAWTDWMDDDSRILVMVERCTSCGRHMDAAASRRGRSARRLGGDAERRIERVYGPTKRGEYGDAVDHLGRVWRWQSKATRSLPPRWLAAISEPTWRATLPVALERAWHGMGPHFTDHARVVIRSFVRHGVATRDWLFVGAADATEELGLPRRAGGWWMLPGSWWLDRFGKDET